MRRSARVLFVVAGIAISGGVVALPACNASDVASQSDASSDARACIKATSPNELLEAGTCYCDVNAKLMDSALTCAEKVVVSPGFCIRGASEPSLSTQILCAKSPDGETYVTDIPLDYEAFGTGWTFARFGSAGSVPSASMDPCAKLAVRLSPQSGGGDAFSGSIAMCGAADAGGDGGD